MKKWYNDSTNEFCKALLLLESVDECYEFLEDICTIKEILDISQRLSVAKMLKNGTSYSEITKATGASAATISRVSKALDYGSGGYELMLDRLDSQR